MVYQDPMSSLNPLLRDRLPDRRDAARPRRRRRRARRARTREVLGHVGLPDPARIESAYPARALRRDAPARDDRDGARDLAAGARRRRADDRARRHDPAADPRPRRAAPGRDRDGGRLGDARPRRRRAARRPGRGHVRGPDRRARLDARDLRAARSIPTRRRCSASLPGPSAEHRRAAAPDRRRRRPTRRSSTGGCPFRFRCPSADDRCAAEEPPLLDRGPGQLAACWKEPSTWAS